MTKFTYPSVMTVAGFDPSGGAGIQADIKTISALGCYATSVLTALPVQNTCGVRSIHSIPLEVVGEQIRAVMDDIVPQAIKIGMVHSSELVDVIVEGLGEYASAGGEVDAGWRDRIVFDPVMVATSGHKLIEDQTISAIAERLFPLAAIITPNMDEAAVLAEMAIETVDDMYVAGRKILALGCRALLLKGGHLRTAQLTSLFFAPDGSVTELHSPRYDTHNTHGSGCTLSSAIASFLARGESLPDAVARAQSYVTEAIRCGRDVTIGRGNGPLNHFHNPEKLILN
ncbi:MAG: bifunctional hydroxymethylpyrimidine kinase/phosphomethylpyrimidine kinase [Alistipes sp.]|jgi:hydroxymethylpyrimidine/phosphomethylpyrimidine kinase|nr:bifunctional hydroxymethylpyrimidine kinase/phosphomethylpyrimidine kinase [Alistipes sp.]